MAERRRMTYEEMRAARDGQQPPARATRGQAPGARTSGQQARTARTAGGRSASRASRPPSARMGGNQAASHPSARTTGEQPASRTSITRAPRTRHDGEVAAQRPPVFKVAIAVVLLVVVVLAVRMCMAATPINVTVNGTPYELRGSKTMQTAIKASGLPINPGDFISLNGNVLEKSAGEPFFATVNGDETSDPDYGLRDGDNVTITDGKDIVEDFEATEEAIPYGAIITGMGAVHKFEEGTEGVLETRTGLASGETVQRQTVSPVDVTCKEYNVNAGANKVVAFTFDDGPSSEYTASVLQILEENEAKATFFCIGTEVEAYPDLVKREHEAGHQVCTHTYDHADPVGGTDVGLMDAAGQVDEVLHGMKTITDVLGGEASRVVRMPGGNLSEDMVKNLQPYVDYEIGWNIDTQDWTLPGAEAIYQQMIAVEPGQIVLCHDGGGDRSQTVEALGRALPYLKKKGFTFVTMDELLKYPAAA